METDAQTLPVADSTLPPVAVSGNQVELPHVAKPANVVEFQPRGTVASPANPNRNIATGGKKGVKSPRDKGPVVEVVKASKGTWAFRLRWNSLPDRPVQYITRVDDRTYNLITSEKETYERYKRQVLQIYRESAVPANNQSASSANRSL